MASKLADGLRIMRNGGIGVSIGSNGNTSMKIVIPGGSGQVGTVLARAFQQEGHDVVVLSRTPESAAWRVLPLTQGPRS